MAVTSFIPEIWNSQLLLDFREQTVAVALTNREYEGDARTGNVVTINTAAAIPVADYKAAGRTTSASAVSSVSQDLLIDQEKSFDFYVDDIDRAQAAGSMDAFTRSAGEGMAEDADKFVLATAVTGALAANVTTDATALTLPDVAWDKIRDLRKVLNKQHVPQSQRVLVINAEFEAILLGASSKFTHADVSGTTQGLRDAALGRILGFDVYVSENLPVTANPQALAFYRPAVAYVSQVTNTEAMRAQDKFADRLRGLHVYGGKVIRDEAVAVYTNTAV